MRPKVYYQLPKVYGVKSCVYKLSFNDYYIIVKAKDHVQSVATIQKCLNQFLRDSEFQRKPDNLYFHFFSFVEKQDDGVFIVDILLESENQYQLLKEEQLQLEKCKDDSKCLNNNISPYIPLYNDETQSYGWITKNAYLNFKKWLKSRQ